MANFMGSDDNSAETASILNDGNAVYLLEPFVDHASTANISKT
jgi:hypothetical protein